MEPSSRSSSVYSNASPDRKPTYLDHGNYPSIATASRPSSRKASYTPSYMSQAASKSIESSIGARSSPVSVPQPVKRKSIKQSTIRPPGALLVFMAPGLVNPSMLSYIEMLLDRQPLDRITFAVHQSQEKDMKQLKIDVYSILGKMGKEVAVSVDIKENWEFKEMDVLVCEVARGGAGIQGVLCCLPPSISDERPDWCQTVEKLEIYNLDTNDLESNWRQNVAFVHTVMRSTTPELLLRCTRDDAATSEHSRRSLQSPFFIVASPARDSLSSRLTMATCDTVLDLLRRSTRPAGLTSGYAESLLVREPTPPPSAKEDRPPLQLQLQANGDHSFPPPESPTRLWNMWALQNDLPAAGSY